MNIWTISFHLLALMNNVALNMDIHISLWDSFNSFGYISRKEVSGSDLISFKSNISVAARQEDKVKAGRPVRRAYPQIQESDEALLG